MEFLRPRTPSIDETGFFDTDGAGFDGIEGVSAYSDDIVSSAASGLWAPSSPPRASQVSNNEDSLWSLLSDHTPDFNGIPQIDNLTVSDFESLYNSEPQGDQGLVNLPLDGFLDDISLAFSTPKRQKKPPPPKPSPPTYDKTMCLNIANFQEQLSAAHVPQQHVKSLLVQSRVAKMGWTCAQFETAVRMF